jgi:hypothetical protein
MSEDDSFKTPVSKLKSSSGYTLKIATERSDMKSGEKRFFFIIPDRAQLQPALDKLTAAGIDAAAVDRNPEVATNPPTRAGVTVANSQAAEAREILTNDGIRFLVQEPVTPS